METNEILTQEEIDALLSSVEDSPEPVENNADTKYKDVKRVDFSNHNKLLNSGVPVLNTAHERFSLQFCESISNTMHCASKVEFKGTQVISFIDYLNSMDLPTYINFIKLKPMVGLALAVVDSDLIGMMVNRFFGGSTNHEASKNKRDFTPSETRMGSMLLGSAFADLKTAWQALLAMEPELVQTETNPDFAHILNPSEPLMLNTFEVQFDNNCGTFQLAIPHTMIEPLNDQFASSYEVDNSEISGAWTPIIMEEMKLATMEVTSVLGKADLTVKDMLDLAPGDVIPLDVPEKHTVYAEGVPVLMGTFGAYNGKNSIKVTSKVSRR